MHFVGLFFLHPPIRWTPGDLYLMVNRIGREADHSPASSTEAKNERSYTSTHAICLHGVHRGRSYLYIQELLITRQCYRHNTLLWGHSSPLTDNEFWHVTPCMLTEIYKYFGRMKCLHLHDGSKWLVTQRNLNQTVWRHIRGINGQNDTVVGIPISRFLNLE